MWVGAACELDLDVCPTKRAAPSHDGENILQSVVLGSCNNLKGVGLSSFPPNVGVVAVPFTCPLSDLALQRARPGVNTVNRVSSTRFKPHSQVRRSMRPPRQSRVRFFYRA